MSAHVVVIATDLRRTTVKVSSGTYLVDVLQEACGKLSLAGDKYLLRHKQKQVDLSVPFRTSGLLPGAKLELVQKANTPSAVQVALQIPQPEAKEIPGGRLIGRFPSDLTLWKMLRQFESGEASGGRNLNVTARGVARGQGSAGGSGQLYYETPVLNIMGRELSTLADLQKTLSQLGHNSGNVLIRLSYRATTQTLFEAMEQISRFFQETQAPDGKTEVDKAPDGKLEEDKTPDGKAEEDKTPEQPHRDTAMADDAPPASSPTIDAPETLPSPAPHPPASPTAEAVSSNEPPASGENAYQPVGVFLAPTGTTPAAALRPADEDDFTPTIAHAQLHQARLQEWSRNKRLPSDKELEARAAADEARVAAIQSVLVKVRFPDNTSGNWRVGPRETGAFLYEAVRRVMASRQLPFRLVLPGGRTTIRDGDGPRDGLIKAYRLAGRVLVSLVWDDAVPAEARVPPFLRDDVALRGQAVEVPELPPAREPEAPAPAAQSAGGGGVDRGEGRADAGAKKMPKWFKLGKK